MKIFSVTFFTLLMLLSFQARAEFSGHVDIVSDYRFNGVSYTERQPALQAGLTFVGSTGIYVSTWASNVDFGKEDPSNVEWDFFMGLSDSLGENVEGDIGIGYYTYHGKTGAPDSNYFEVYAGVTLYTNTSIYLFYADEYFGTEAGHYIIKLAYDIPLGNYLLNIAVTQNESLDVDAYAWTEHGGSYQSLEVSGSREWRDFSVTATFTATTIDSGEYKKNARPALVIGGSYLF